MYNFGIDNNHCERTQATNGYGSVHAAKLRVRCRSNKGSLTRASPVDFLHPASGREVVRIFLNIRNRECSFLQGSMGDRISDAEEVVYAVAEVAHS